MNDFKIAHLSDLHAGYKSTRLHNAQDINLREADGYIALGKLITDIIAHEVNAVVMSGDTFHIPTPDVRSILFVQNQMRRLWTARIPVYILAGNHDTNDIKADIAASRLLHDPARKIYSHIEPYVNYEIGPNIYLHLISHHMYSEQAATMATIKPVQDSINILATHGSVIDPILKIKLHAEHSPREIVIPDYLLEDYAWDYAFLGHIHERGWVGSRDGKSDTAKSKIYYNGSLVRRGFSDKECKLGRGWTLWNINSEGVFTASPKTVPQRPQIDFPTIDAVGKTAGEVSELIINHLKSTQVNGPEFDARVAPILRQRIKGIEPSKYSALDLKAINQNSSHALQWAMQTIAVTDNDTTKKTVGDFQGLDSTDMVKLYDGWVENSEKLSKTDEAIKKMVQDQARTFVELGQEVTLND